MRDMYLVEHHVYVDLVVQVGQWKEPHSALEDQVEFILLPGKLGGHIQDVLLPAQLVELAVPCKHRDVSTWVLG